MADRFFMWISRDRRSLQEQAKSGVRIAGAMIASLAALTLIAIAYTQITRADGGRQVLFGWRLISAIAVFLMMTVHYWRHWFFFLPGYVTIRSSLWVFLGWLSPRGYILIVFLFLMAVMAVLSYRFSRLARIFIGDRVVLISVLICFLASVTAAWSKEPKASFFLGGAADFILFLRWIVVRKRSIRQRRDVGDGTLLTAFDR